MTAARDRRSRKANKVLEGTRFGRITILNFSKMDKWGQAWYSCKCDCGTIKENNIQPLKRGTVVSCGCFQAEEARKRKTWKSPGEVSYHFLFKACQYGSAVERGLEFLLSKEEHKHIISQPCFYCENLPTPFNGYLKKDGTNRKYGGVGDVSDEAVQRAWIMANGIDRIKNEIGYTVENCVPCCWPCNEMKSDRSVEDFLLHIKKIQSFQDKKLK